MAFSLGQRTEAVSSPKALAEARPQAALIPDLLVEARRVVASVSSGWHGRRRRGQGENFWQFRPFVDGEPVSRIDWRRSARDDSLFLRDREWEAAQTVWLWADRSLSMRFRSNRAAVSKEERALVVVLALAELLSRSGERVGWPGLAEPVAARNGAERLAARLANDEPSVGLPPTDRMKRFCELVLVSDVLDPVDEVETWLRESARRGVRGHLVQICDPVELAFPYDGRTEFVDPESGARLTAGRAQVLGEEYRRLFEARRHHFAEECRRLGWTYVFHVTDRPASEALLALHARLGGLALAGASR